MRRAMGYCPRCGENPPWGINRVPTSTARARRPVRIHVSSPIVRIPASIQDGERIHYGGTLFTVRRYGDIIELHAVTH